MIEAVRTSETSVYFNETARLYIPEACGLCAHRRGNLKSHSESLVQVSALILSRSSFPPHLQPNEQACRRY
jgi:hypothetical protein